MVPEQLSLAFLRSDEGEPFRSFISVIDTRLC